MKPIIELSGLLSFRLFKTYLPLAHHSSWNVLEEINAARTQMPTLIQRHDAVWMKLRTQASLYQITSLLFMNMEEKGRKKKSAMASRCNYKDIQQKDTQFRFSNLPVWNMHDNVLLNKDLQCSKRLWHFTFAQTIGYFSMFLNVIFDPLSFFSFVLFVFLRKLIRLSPLSTQAATNE